MGTGADLNTSLASAPMTGKLERSGVYQMFCYSYDVTFADGRVESGVIEEEIKDCAEGIEVLTTKHSDAIEVKVRRLTRERLAEIQSFRNREATDP